MQSIIWVTKTKAPVKKFHTGYCYISLFFIFSLLFFGCGEYELSSKWLDREITIDGTDTEWEGARYLIEGKNATIGLLNDENYLYLRLSTPDPTVQTQIAGLGLTVWFDPEGGRKKTFGIHCPIGNPDTGIRIAGRGPMRGGSRNKDDNLETFEKILELSQKNVEIIGPGEDERSTLLKSEAEIRKISVKVGISRRNIVYELKIPLVLDYQDRFTLGTVGQDEMIGIGFETGRMDMTKENEIREERRREADGLQRERQRMDGIGRTERGRYGTDRMRPGGRMIPDPFEMWGKIKLATKSAD
ncbi:hypothetical protein ACFL5B_02065 [Candidatus Latescibacterota bacterium]